MRFPLRWRLRRPGTARHDVGQRRFAARPAHDDDVRTAEDGYWREAPSRGDLYWIFKTSKRGISRTTRATCGERNLVHVPYDKVKWRIGTHRPLCEGHLHSYSENRNIKPTKFALTGLHCDRRTGQPNPTFSGRAILLLQNVALQRCLLFALTAKHLGTLNGIRWRHREGSKFATSQIGTVTFSRHLRMRYMPALSSSYD